MYLRYSTTNVDYSMLHWRLRKPNELKGLMIHYELPCSMKLTARHKNGPIVYVDDNFEALHIAFLLNQIKFQSSCIQWTER